MKPGPESKRIFDEKIALRKANLLAEYTRKYGTPEQMDYSGLIKEFEKYNPGKIISENQFKKMSHSDLTDPNLGKRTLGYIKCQKCRMYFPSVEIYKMHKLTHKGRKIEDFPILLEFTNSMWVSPKRLTRKTMKPKKSSIFFPL